MSKPAIHVVDLHKDFGEVYAVSYLSDQCEYPSVAGLKIPAHVGDS
jgi:hypothetical protein